MQNELRPFWCKFFNYDWKFGLFLIVIICIPRFIIVLNANETANYTYIALIMVTSAIVPFIFSSKYGRKTIGLIKSHKYSWFLLAIVSGFAFSVVLYFIRDLFYGSSYYNWYVYIGKSYNVPLGIAGNAKFTLFLMMAVSGMIFSPIGEELFFRGIVHFSFAKSLGNVKASIVDSTAFALTHISHFGLVFIDGKWNLLSIPTLIWASSMFLLSILIFICKYKSNSLLGAILCHSGFNLGMIYSIFYLIN